MDTLLRIEDVSKSFGGICAVKQLSIDVEKSTILSIIGPNGAGKTTAFNLLTGFYKPDTGNFWYGEANITGFPPYEVARLGIARTFQNIRIFPWMTALDNVLVARQLRERTGLVRSMFKTRFLVSEEKKSAGKAMDILAHFHLAEKWDFQAKNLSYGEQRKLEMARALATEPSVLLLDEPTAGMSGGEREECVKVIDEIKEKLRLTIILIEHDMNIVMNVSNKVVVLDHGEKIAEGNPSDIQKDKAVIRAYLGEEYIKYAEDREN